ncbi:S-layer homology domain-containing protein [Paenibacillus sp. LMG 31460]|uniref:S-layer homology domain-containing protein n=1 Tax=Paenibacillus germinis TaxID=2654979 RepID=A0ABX1ZAV7_9BACL|nr:S-layer homology domain-containing protein [Paenibacillus germinis]
MAKIITFRLHKEELVLKTKQLRNKWISISLLITMLLALLPPMTASAAPVLNITNLYVHTIPTAADPLVDASIQRFTANPITVSVDIGGIAEEQITDIYYEIYNVNTGLSSTNKTNRPTRVANSTNQITFENVQLTEGLNRFTVKFNSTSNVDSIPGWAYFTPVSNITGLMFNDDAFADGAMLPSQGPFSNATITGSANNALKVDAIVNGTTFEASNFAGGVFTFLTNTGRVSDIVLNPGDNKIQFIAKNPTNYYTTTRTFKYDNGLGFGYNGTISMKEATAQPVYPLVTVPTLSSGTSKDVIFTTDIKNSIGNITPGVADYVYADIKVVGSGAGFRYTFANQSISNVTGTLWGGGSPTLIGTPTITPAAIGVGTKYQTHNISASLPLSATTTAQEIDVTLSSSLGAATQPTRYTFNFTNPTLPYLDHVAQDLGGSPIVLTEQGSNQINDFPAAIDIYTNALTTSVDVFIPGFAGNGSYPTVAAGALRKATVSLHDIPDGPTTLTVTPSGGAPVTSNPAGKKVYNLNISSAPYVIVTNLYNGKVVTSKAQFTCGAVGAPCIAGKIVNLPAANYPLVELSINDNNVPLTNGLASVINSTTGEFIINEASLNAVTGGSGTTFSGLFDSDGKKAIRFSLYLKPNPAQPKVLVTQTNYEVFVLSDYAPLVESLIPDVAVTPYTVGTLPGVYQTTSNKIQLTGTVLNATLNTQAILYLRKPPVGSAVPVGPLTLNPISAVIDPLDNKRSTTTFNLSSVLNMDAYGDYIFELVATNASGRTTSKMITITKQPVTYVLLQPTNFVKNVDKVDQANVNTNSETIVIQADGADSVLFGKSEATQTTPGVFRYEVTTLKAGKNTVTFTVNRGKTKSNGSFVLFNVNTPIEGAQYKTTLASKMSIFNGDFLLNFPKDTKLMRNDRTQSEQFITVDRKIVFGIANQDDGRVEKASETPAGTRFLIEPTGRFRPASKRFWVDAGTIDMSAASTPDSLKAALQGSGNLPSPTLLGPGETAFYTRNIKSLVVPTQRGTLTMKYDAEIRNDSWKYLSVYQFGTFLDPSGTGNQFVGWKNIGGVVDPKTHTIEVPVDTFGYFQVMYMDNSFNDVTLHDWARDYLDILYSKGIMNNKSAGQFLPNDAITRGEFVTLLVKIFEIPLINEDTTHHTNDPTDPNFQGTFADVRRGLGLSNSSSLYDFMHIEAGARAGIVRGNSAGLFAPGNSISREDASVMIERAANMKVNSDPAKSLLTLKKEFTDAGNISVYAQPSVEAVMKAGFIDGIENALVEGQKKPTFSFDPKGNLTRAQAAAIVIRVLKQQKKIPK